MRGSAGSVGSIGSIGSVDGVRRNGLGIGGLRFSSTLPTLPTLSTLPALYAFTLAVSRFSSGTQSSMRNAAAKDETTKIV